jgi:hypothetical protein
MATEWVRVRNPRSGGEAVVPRSAVGLMPKWKEVKPTKKKSGRASEPSANQSSGDTAPEQTTGNEPADGEESTDARVRTEPTERD